MSFLLGAARGLTALGVASQLGPANPVDFTLDIVCAIFVSIACLVSCLFVFKIQDSVTTKDPVTGKETPNQMKGYTIGILVPLFLGLIAGGGLHQFRWNMANPAYYAAEQGLNALF
jgi:hypothetical protein